MYSKKYIWLDLWKLGQILWTKSPICSLISGLPKALKSLQLREKKKKNRERGARKGRQESGGK